MEIAYNKETDKFVAFGNLEELAKLMAPMQRLTPEEFLTWLADQDVTVGFWLKIEIERK